MNSKKILWAALLLSVMLPFLSYSQESSLGNWLIYIGNKKIDSKWNWHHEIQYRNYDMVGDLEQLLLRTGVGFNLSEKNNNILLGYGFIRSDNYSDDIDTKFTVNEHRIYQQFVNKHKTNRLYVQHRFRFEQRFIESIEKLRLRYFLNLKLPLSNPELADGTYYLSMYNEIFLNTEDDIFDRNRLYGGLGYKLNSNISMELGYMNQFFKVGGRDQLNLLVLANF